jgi:hypothetical protein
VEARGARVSLIKLANLELVHAIIGKSCVSLGRVQLVKYLPVFDTAIQRERIKHGEK